MSQTGKQDLDESLASPAALEKQLAEWARRQRIRGRIHAGSALMFFIGMGAALWLCFEEPSKTSQAAVSAIAFAVIGIFHTILALSSREQTHAAQKCGDALKKKDNNPI